MISVVGSRDERRRLGLGFGGEEREMDDSELEEGEACSSQINEYDPNIDPDVALAYIDDKIQDVLGHFQKDFEGGVSAENLGAKFGGYGSFLPAYQRSPGWSHPRTPAKNQSYCLPKSPNSLKHEGGHRNNSVRHAASHSVGLGTASINSISLVAPKAPDSNVPVKQEVTMSCNHADQYPPEQGSATKKPFNLSDQKTLKVRLKVGSDNLSTQKNDIYNGLGLGTPSSSLDDSPSDSDGISHEPQDASNESPTSILQIMTSCPVYEDLLLSPLPDNLIYLIEREKIQKEVRSVPLPRDGSERSGFVVNGAYTREGGGKVRKTKAVERNDFSAESKSGNMKDGIKLPTKKEQDIDMFACEELVSETLKLPLLSNSNSSVNGVTKRKVDKNVSRDNGFPGQAAVEPMEPSSNQEQGWVEKRKSSLAGKGQEDRKSSVHTKKEGHHKGEKSNESVKADSHISRGRKAINTEVVDNSKQKVSQKGISDQVDDMRLLSGKEHPMVGEKKKSKENSRTPVADFQKESSRVGSSSVPKGQNTHVNNCTANSESEKIKNDIGKSRDTYRDVFGEEEEEEENQIGSVQLLSEEKLKDSEAVSKSTSAVNIAVREKLSGKTVDAYPAIASNIAPRSGNGPVSDAAPGTGPALIEDNWVCCDKCQKWRLLPHGTNPDNLPEKWLCSMLNWLPGMNRCIVTEEESTEKTKALIAQYQVPVPAIQNNLGGVMENVAMAKVRPPDQSTENFGSPGMPIGGKKRNVSKELSSATDKDGGIQLSNSMKKNIQASLQSRSLNDVNEAPSLNERDFQQLSNSSDMAMEKRKHKYKEKHKSSDPSFVGGDIKNLKTKSTRDSDPETSRSSKKIKSEDKRITDEESALYYHRAVGEVGPSSSNGFPTTEAGKDRTKDRLESASHTKVKDEMCRDNRSLNMGNGSRDRPKKRKSKESEIYTGSLPTLERSAVVKEEFSENDCRKDKKARISKSEGKESSASKGSGRTDKKSSHTKNQQRGKDTGSGLTSRSRNGMDSLRKDLGPVHVSVAATSSSSKVSGSQKTKSSFQEVKGSPVESVSSSPMRILNEKHASVRRDLGRKDESQDAGHFALGSPRRCSDGDDDGRSDRSGTARKDKISSGAYDRPEYLLPDVQVQDFNHLSGDKARGPSPDITNNISTNDALDNSGPDSRSPIKPLASNQFTGEDSGNGSHYHANGSRPRNSGKGYSSRSKAKIGDFESDSDMVKVKNSKFLNEQQDHSPANGIKLSDGKNKLQEKFGNKHSSKKDFTGKSLNECSKKEAQSSFGVHDTPEVRLDAINSKDAISTPKKLQDCDSERSSKRISSERTDRVDTGSIRGKSLPLPPSGAAQHEMMTRCPRPVSGSHKGNGADILQVDGSEGNDVPKVNLHTRKAENGTQHTGSRYHTQNGHRARDLDAPSPARRNSSSQAGTLLKEARELKHLADRLRHAGSSESTSESTALYFQAVLKFLHAASLLESSNTESAAKHMDPIQIYRDTAKLCQFCAQEYERSKDMATAALAYKCLEVAYFKVIYSSHNNASRDRHELQTTLQMVPPGESPSSSASDVDNLNNPSTVDKVALPKGVSSPQIAGNHVIAARNRHNFVRMLNFTQDVNSAMDASKKSRIAFAAADLKGAEAKYSEGIASVKRALDFNFQDVQGLLRLVRLAMEAVSR